MFLLPSVLLLRQCGSTRARPVLFPILLASNLQLESHFGPCQSNLWLLPMVQTLLMKIASTGLGMIDKIGRLRSPSNIRRLPFCHLRRIVAFILCKRSYVTRRHVPFNRSLSSPTGAHPRLSYRDGHSRNHVIIPLLFAITWSFSDQLFTNTNLNLFERLVPASPVKYVIHFLICIVNLLL